MLAFEGHFRELQRLSGVVNAETVNQRREHRVESKSQETDRPREQE